MKAKQTTQQIQRIGEQVSSGVQSIKQKISGRFKSDNKGTYARVPTQDDQLQDLIRRDQHDGNPYDVEYNLRNQESNTPNEVDTNYNAAVTIQRAVRGPKWKNKAAAVRENRIKNSAVY